MKHAVAAGVAYFACIFAVGFALGVPRRLLVVPAMGETAAVALELPVILAIAWIVCRWLVRRTHLSAAIADRAVMGLLALVLLLAGEALISLTLGGRSPNEHLQLYRETGHQLGLAGQVAFALFPLLQRR